MNALSHPDRQAVEIAQLHNDECGELLSAALKVESDQRAAADPAYAVRRLLASADDKDAEAERHMVANSDAAGLAAGRRLRWGADDPFAASFDREAAACLALAFAAMTEAELLRAEAADLSRAQACADAFRTLFDGVSARISTQLEAAE